MGRMVGILCLLFATINSRLVLAGLTDPGLPIAKVSAPAQPRTMNCWFVNSTADCAWANWNTIPGLDPKYPITTVLLHNNKIPNIAGTSLNGWPTDIITIDLSNNKIATLDSYAFKRFRSLRYLDLGGNLISTLSDPFTNLLQLEGLSLRKNNLSRFSLVYPQSQLTTLLLDHNQLTDLSALKSLFASLETLTLQSNNLTAIGALPTGLLYLDIRDNAFVNFTKGGPLAGLASLMTLRLGQRSFVPSIDDIAGLLNLSALELANIQGAYPNQYLRQGLQRLFISGNAAKIAINLPTNVTEVEIHNFPTITIIDVFPITIQKLTITDCPNLYLNFVAFAPLRKLTHLHFRAVSIGDKNQARHEMLQGKLVYLVLESCSFTAVESFKALLNNDGTTLTTLDMKRNSIAVIEPVKIQYLSAVRNVTFSYNRLTSFSFGTFRFNSMLNYIDLSYNLISVVYNDNLPANRPYTLNLAGNRITKIDSSFLHALPALRVFDLSHNHLAEYSAFSSVSAPDLKVVSAGNLWPCDCGNVTAFEQLLNTTSFVCDQTAAASSVPCVVCHVPASVKGMNITSVACGGATTVPTSVTQPSDTISVTQPVVTATRTVNVNATAESAKSMNLYIIIGASAGGGLLLVVVVVVVACLVVKKRRKNNPIRETRAVDMGPALAVPTHMEKPPSPERELNSNAANTVYLEADKPETLTAVPNQSNALYDEPDHDKINAMERERGQKAANRPSTFLEKMKEKAPEPSNEKSLYEDGYMVTPAGQSIPEPVVPAQPPVSLDHGYQNYPSVGTPASRLSSMADLADRQSFGNLGALITRLYASGENQAAHDYVNDGRHESDDSLYMEAK